MQSAKSDNVNDKNPYHNLHSGGGMTPSIITTINNTSPTPPTNSNNNNCNTAPRGNTKRPAEPYESYIEDSFVGHWEREDDDPDEEYNMRNNNEDPNCAEEDPSALHPSAIEFDFDSFGPESFIYTPARAKQTSGIENAGSDNAVGTDPPTPRANSPTDASSIRAVELISKSREQLVQSDTQEDEQINRLELNHEVSSSTTTTHNSVKPCTHNPNPLDYLVETAQIDLKVIEPYRKVISHAGYCHHFDPSAPAAKLGEPAPAVIVFSACYLPDRSRRDYNYVMDHLFLYVLSSLHELIADDYILVYLHNTQPSTLTSSFSFKTSGSSSGSSPSSSNSEDAQLQNNLPTFTWMKRCYQMIDRKLRKNLKILYLVKPTFWLKTIVIMCRPFISAKFSKKLRFVEDMEGLKKCIPVDKLILPASAANI